ncbi:MAG: hypothetical protein OS112_09155 [Methanoregula sp.]|nr:MAG: hypothetical protein OS112_09155 [Methanoregula sp.]
MRTRNCLFGILFIACICLLVQPLQAQTEQTVIYQNSFATSPGWQTNNPSSDYWVPDKGLYHYSIEASTGNYAYTDVDFSDGPFTLEYDWMPISTDETATFRLGFAGKEMNRNKGPLVLSEFKNGKNGRLMYLRVITQSSKLLTVASGQGDEDTPCYGGMKLGQSNCGPMVRFEDNKTYHVVLNYNDLDQQVTMSVSEKTTGRQIWSYYLSTVDSLRGMNRIFLGSVGDYGSMMGRYATGYIDNVKLSTETTVVTTPTVATSPPITPRVTITTRPTTKPTTAVPAQTTTPESPVSPLILFAAPCIAACVLSHSISRRKQ